MQEIDKGGFGKGKNLALSSAGCPRRLIRLSAPFTALALSFWRGRKTQSTINAQDDR